jgi:integrase
MSISFAIHQGYRTDNPVTVTRTKNEPDRQRLRHTLEGYNTIYKVAHQWLRNAMDIALRSLQRRADIVSLQRDQVDLSTNTIKVLQEKTRTYTKPIYIEIEMGPELREAVERCLNSGIDCPYLIHTRPERITKQVRDSKPHLYAVTEDHLTKQFKYYRDLSSAYDHIPANIRPTFHDLRALGVWLYQQEGFHDEYIMALSVHVEIQTLERYKAGHSVPKPKKVSANLTLDRNPKKKT